MINKIKKHLVGIGAGGQNVFAKQQVTVIIISRLYLIIKGHPSFGEIIYYIVQKMAL